MNFIGSKIKHSLAVYGILGTGLLCVKKAIQYLIWLNPSYRQHLKIVQERDMQFDRKWGVETSGTLVPTKSETVGWGWLFGIRYQGCNADLLNDILGNISIKHDDFTFIDFGSGKGRAILVASRFPFKKIIGVEYSKKLIQIARHNVTSFPNGEKRCREIKIFHANAATFPIPQGPLFIFLYNPFGRQVMRTLVKNVSVSFQQNPRRIILVYFHPLFADEWKKVGFFIEIRRSKEIAIYDTQSSGAFGHAGHKSVPTIFSSLHIILKGLLLGKELLLKRLLFRHNMNNAFYA